MTELLSAPPAGIDGAGLLRRLHRLGEIGRGDDGALTRLALSDADREARDTVRRWMEELRMDVEVDIVGNVFGTWRPQGASGAPVMMGSHLDTVVDAGIYDGAYGVLAGLEVVAALQRLGCAPRRPVTVAVFTNEEGVRFAPDLLGSLVFAGALDPALALAAEDAAGIRLGEELERTGYAGTLPPLALRPEAYLEVHIEQGPLLEHDGVRIGAVEGVQAMSWQRIAIRGEAGHAGTTPMRLRRDAGVAAARIVTFLADLTARPGSTTLATTGALRVRPDVYNVIPGAATLTVDLRDPDDACLARTEAALSAFLEGLAAELRVEIRAELQSRVAPVRFDPRLVEVVERAAVASGASVRRITSGAGHDAQAVARAAPTGMVFVPSRNGSSHSPSESTDPDDLVLGADVLLSVVARLADVGL